MPFNIYLQDSFKTNELNIKITNRDYSIINENVEKLNKYYMEEVNRLYANGHNLSIMNEHCKLVKDIITYVIHLYPEMAAYSANAFLTGSFARCSCKKNSDLDFHIVYLREYCDDSLKYEEIIYYMLSMIFNLGRNKIHPMLITKMHPSILSYLEQELDDEDLKINLISDIGQFNYKINGNIKRRIYLQYCTENTMDKVISYLKNEIDGKNNEWAHVICPITNIKGFNAYENELFAYEKAAVSPSKIQSRIAGINSKIVKIDSLMKIIDESNISEFKDLYQKREFGLINDYISLKRDINILHNGEWKRINYNDNLEYLEYDNTFKKALEYMFLLFRLTEPLGNRYSLHTNEIIQINDIDIIKKKLQELNSQIYLEISREDDKINGKNSNNDANSSIQKVFCRQNVNSNFSKKYSQKIKC